MRWMEKKPKYEWKAGERFTLSHFAILPIKVGREWRWLEKVTVEYEVAVAVEDGRFYYKMLRFVD